MVDRLFVGNVQLIRALRPLVEAAETTLHLDEAKRRPKTRFEAQHLLALLGSLAHNVVVWACQWLSSQKIAHDGLLCMVHDVFPISGLLRFDVAGLVVEVVLNQQSCLAHSFLHPLQALLAPLQIVVRLGET